MEVQQLALNWVSLGNVGDNTRAQKWYQITPNILENPHNDKNPFQVE